MAVRRENDALAAFEQQLARLWIGRHKLNDRCILALLVAHAEALLCREAVANVLQCHHQWGCCMRKAVAFVRERARTRCAHTEMHTQMHSQAHTSPTLTHVHANTLLRTCAPHTLSSWMVLRMSSKCCMTSARDCLLKVRSNISSERRMLCTSRTATWSNTRAPSWMLMERIDPLK